jgi:hypothetical protein
MSQMHDSSNSGCCVTRDNTIIDYYFFEVGHFKQLEDVTAQTTVIALDAFY